jgi:signal transduction histidine kinase
VPRTKPKLAAGTPLPENLVMERNRLLAERWELGALIGEGGNARVFEGRDRSGGDPVAIKLFPPSPGLLPQLRRELRILADAAVPGVARLIDAGPVPDGGAFLVLERVPGEPIDRVVPPGDERGALEAAVAVARILSRLHARGLVHGDISPPNILARRTPEGPLEAHLLDFGLAAEAGRSRRSRLTGTLGFIAPERFRGGRASPASDLWSLGAVVFRLFSGEAPHSGFAVAEAAAGGERLFARVAMLAGSAPKLAALLERLLDPDPRRRWASAAEAARAASELLGEGDLSLQGEDEEERIVGRSAALARLRRALRELEGGRGGAIALLGSPGAGRTTLLDRLMAEAALASKVTRIRPRSVDDALVAIRGGSGERSLVLLDDLRPDELAPADEALRLAAGGRALLLVAASRPPAGSAPFEAILLGPLSQRDSERLLASRLGSADAAAALLPHLPGKWLPGELLDAADRIERAGLLVGRGASRALVPGFERSLAGVLQAGGALPSVAGRRAVLRELGRAAALRIAGDLEGGGRILESLRPELRSVGQLVELERAELSIDRGRAETAEPILVRLASSRTLPADRKARVARLFAGIEEETGRTKEARRRLERALAATSRLPRRGSLVAERVALAASLALLERSSGRLEEARGALSTARVEAGRRQELALPVLIDLGHVELAAGRLADAERAYSEGLGLARALGDGKRTADAENGLGLVALGRNRPARAASRFARSSRLFRAAGRRREAGRAANNLAIAAWLRGDLPRAFDAWELAELLALARGERMEAAHVAGNRGLALVRSGQAERGVALLETAVERLAGLDDPVGRSELLGNLAEALLRTGRAVPAMERARAAIDEAERAGPAGAGGAREGRIRLVEALVAVGRIDEAVAELGRIGGADDAQQGTIDRLAARIAFAEGREGEGVERLESAAVRLDRSGATDEAGRAWLELAEAFYRAGRPPEAIRAARGAERRLAGRLSAEEGERIRRMIPAADDGAGARDLARLLEILRAFAATSELDPLLETILDRALEATDTDRAFLLLTDDRGRPELRAARDRVGRTLRGRDLPISLSVANEVLEGGSPLVLADAASEERFRAAKSIRDLGLRTILALPLLSGNRRIGLLYVDSSRRSDFAAGDRLPFVEALAASAATAIENGRAREREGKRRDLVAMAAHELQTPIASLAAIAALLADGEKLDPDFRKETIETVGLLARRMKTTVASILDLARLERDQPLSVWGPVDLAAVIRESAALVTPAAAGRRIEIALVTDPSAPLPMSSGDADRLIQVVVNLLGNAIKFSPEGSRIELEAAVADPATATGEASLRRGRIERIARWVELRVADRGPGVPEGEREKIFEKFERGSGVAPASARGAGLGLSIARRIASAHGGELFVLPRPGGGSVFVLRLPAEAS